MNIHKLMMAGFAALALGAEAADVTWTGLGDGRRWGDAKNWPGDTLPGDGDAVMIRRGKQQLFLTRPIIFDDRIPILPDAFQSIRIRPGQNDRPGGAGALSDKAQILHRALAELP